MRGKRKLMNLYEDAINEEVKRILDSYIDSFYYYFEYRIKTELLQRLKQDRTEHERAKSIYESIMKPRDYRSLVLANQNELESFAREVQKEVWRTYI